MKPNPSSLCDREKLVSYIASTNVNTVTRVVSVGPVASIAAGAVHAAAIGMHTEHVTLTRLFIATAVFQIGWFMFGLSPTNVVLSPPLKALRPARSPTAKSSFAITSRGQSVSVT